MYPSRCGRRCRRFLVTGLTVAGACLLVTCTAGAVTPTEPGNEPTVSPTSLLSSPSGDLPAGPRSNGTAVLPDGRYVTPAGTSVVTDEEPQNVVLSHDGDRLYLSSEGFEDNPEADVPTGARYISVYDAHDLTAPPVKIEDDALQSGIAESPDGLTLYVAEGMTDSLGVFTRTPGPDGGIGTFTKTADYPLNTGTNKATDFPWGLALSPDGTKAYLTGFSGDSLITVDTATGAVLSSVTTGAYPYGIVLSPDGTTAYVSNWGLYNADKSLDYSSPIDPPPATYGGYNTVNSDSVWAYSLPADGSAPTVIAANKIGQDIDGADVDGGSSPSGMALSPDGGTLAVTSSNDDEVVLLNLDSTEPSDAVPSLNAPDVPQYATSTVDMRALVGSDAVPGPAGDQPDTVAWSHDGKVLFVGEGERNDVAILDPSKIVADSALTTVEGDAGDGVGTTAGPNRDAVIGRIPTAWYPSALQVSADDDDLYIANMRGFGSGPSGGAEVTGDYNSGNISDAVSIHNDVDGVLTDVGLSDACPELAQLSADSDYDNGLTPPTADSGSNGNGYVVPTTYGSGPSTKIKHVFLIIKENRSFDQIFGDSTNPNVDTDGALLTYGDFDTPNVHELANEFALSDNFYATAETSTQGHNAIDETEDDEFVDKVTPSNYAGKFPYGSFDTLPENVPESGFIWDNAARNGVHSTIYGEAEYVVGVGPTALGKSVVDNPVGEIVPGVQENAFTTFDPLYPTQVDVQDAIGPGGDTEGELPAPANDLYNYNDESRAAEFASVGGQALVSQLNVMILFDDHTSGDIAGAQTPENQVAENDHALGEVIDTITHSSYWPSTAVFVTEDDTQGGADHVDAHRTISEVISPYAKRDYVSHVHTSFDSMDKTIDLLLGLPPNSLQEETSTSMADMFISSGQPDDSTYTTLPNNTYPTANNPAPTNPALKDAAALAKTMPRGIDQAGNILPEDLALDRAGELAEHDRNVTPAEPGNVHNTLPVGSPAPVLLGSPAKSAALVADDTSADPSDTCLAAASVTPVLPESRQPIELIGGLAVAVGLGWWGRRNLQRLRHRHRSA